VFRIPLEEANFRIALKNLNDLFNKQQDPRTTSRFESLGQNGTLLVTYQSAQRCSAFQRNHGGSGTVTVAPANRGASYWLAKCLELTRLL
jgi:hypothetical protein